MQVRTPPLPRNQAAQRVKGKSLSSPTRAKLWQSPNTAHTQLGPIEGGSHIWSTYSRSGIYCTEALSAEYRFLWIRTQRNHSACVPTIMWKARELNQFCSAFCFPLKIEETKERTQSSTTKEARAVRRNVSVMRANYDQYSTLTSSPYFPWCYFRRQ